MSVADKLSVHTAYCDGGEYIVYIEIGLSSLAIQP